MQVISEVCAYCPVAALGSPLLKTQNELSGFANSAVPAVCGDTLQ